ncbi:YL1-C domain-containing protein [Mycena indigotica]|uniref:YL1-C domain-containing protein n=1 Tax=Mycena indigotica TaxID=2126181 RepID=A0A8H6W6R3_9AGAR|nr:YL1-C domain-containing protein [Mycena indigotica]KAF7303693.1 YL1-C domain-containing protein [Mycena indigotica]
MSVQFRGPPPKGSTKRKPAPSDGSATPQMPSLAEQLSFLDFPRPFKNPDYIRKGSKRAKHVKAVLTQEREREKAERERRRLEREQADGEGMEIDGEDNKEEEEEFPTYTSIEAPPSLLPQRHYCDITGLEAPYTDPATRLRYHDKSIYELIKGLSPAAVKDYLAARGVNSIVK